MVILHVVVISGGTAWHTALVFWLLAAAAGGGFALLTGESRNGEALVTDLALAAVGGAVITLMSRPLGTDPLAGVYGVRVFWTVAGASLFLSLAHEATPLLRRFGLPVAIGSAGGLTFILLWLGGWPSEPGLVEATYADGLPVKLIAGSLHLRTRGRWPPAVLSLALGQIACASAEQETLTLTFAAGATGSGAGQQLLLADVQPCGRAAALAERIRQLCDGGS